MRRFALARGETNVMIDQVILNLTCTITALYPGELADFEVDGSPASSAASHWADQSHASDPAPTPGDAAPGSVTEMGDSDSDADDEKNKDDDNDEENAAQTASFGAFDGSMLSQLPSVENLIVPSGQDLLNEVVPSGPLPAAQPATEVAANAEGLVGDSDSGNSSPGEKEVATAVDVHLDIEPPPQVFVVANTLSVLRRLHCCIGHCGKVPGLHYHKFIVYRQVVPELTTDYDKRRLNCF